MSGGTEEEDRAKREIVAAVVRDRSAAVNRGFWLVLLVLLLLPTLARASCDWLEVP